jgi:EAL domain-containing protein (putative c-di-GMP-specific phosphodiesterase class I)
MPTTPEDFSLIRVLVVDDQSHVRTFARKVLLTMGITNVTEAADGRDALAAVTQPGAWFDLILCDLQMPERDGIETIRSFGALGLESAIVIMSIETERVIETAGMLAGAQGLRVFGTITKPLTAEKLHPILRRLREVPALPVGDNLNEPGQNFTAAFKNAELFFQYQPKVWMRSGKFAGVEALVRWKQPGFGLRQPESFVPSMEQDEQYSGALTDFTLRETIACAGRWQQAGRELGIAINLSARAFERLDLPERIAALALDARVPPERLTFEVTETDVARDEVRMVDVAARLRLKGFQLSIDKFGTGQSGLTKLQQLPFNEMKIDRSFVHGCSASAKQRAVVEASIALARSLEMTSVAVGIQQRPDWDLLNELGCDKMQGFFIARPMSEEGLEAWAAQWMLK